MQYRIEETNDSAILHLSGDVVVTDRASFEEVVEAVFEHKPRKVQVMLGELTFMDSAGLGLLLMLRDAARAQAANVTLSGAQGQVQEVFETAGFEILFDFE